MRNLEGKGTRDAIKKTEQSKRKIIKNNKELRKKRGGRKNGRVQDRRENLEKPGKSKEKVKLGKLSNQTNNN